MIGNNAGGTHSMMAELYGPRPLTADNVEELEILAYRGERFRVARGDRPELTEEPADHSKNLSDRYGDEIHSCYPDIPRRVSGYNLDRLLPERGFDIAAALVGTESTCVTVLEATLRLIDNRLHVRCSCSATRTQPARPTMRWRCASTV